MKGWGRILLVRKLKDGTGGAWTVILRCPQPCAIFEGSSAQLIGDTRSYCGFLKLLGVRRQLLAKME